MLDCSNLGSGMHIIALRTRVSPQPTQVLSLVEQLAKHPAEHLAE
jgi:hypothetical protein